MPLYTSKAVGEWLGITDRQVRNLRDQGVLSEVRPGVFDMKVCVRQYLKFKIGDKDDQARLVAARAEREETRGKIEKMRMEEAQGDLHRTEEVEHALKTIFANFKNRLETIPTKYASTMAQLTHYHSFDASALLALRKQIKANGETMGMPNITLNDMVLFAVSRILLHHPDLNATMPQENMLRQYHHVHLGMAVDTPKGLFVPTIFNADQMSLAEISTEAKRLAKLCQEGKATPDMLSGATFTVSNVGSLGVEMFTPIVNPPQVGILGVCGTTTRIKEVGGEIKPYQAMGLCLTYDHRAIDGSPASRFVKELCGALENFSLLMMK